MKNLLTKLTSVLISVVVILQGCAALQTEAPKSLDERIAVAHIQLNTVLNTTTNLYISKRINLETAEAVFNVGVSAYEGLKIAKTALNMGDLSKAEEQLKAAQLVLAALNARIAKLEAEQAK